MFIRSNKLLWSFYLIIALILILGNNEQRLYKANLLSKTVFYPLITPINHLIELSNIKKRNLILEKKVADYITLSNSLENRLEEVLSIVNLHNNGNLQHQEQLDFSIASVIAYKGSFTNRILIIDQGATAGIEKSFPVISETGVVGKIISVFPKHSLVLPITSPHFKLGVVNKNTNLQGLLEANISGNIFMTMIRAGSQITVGDTITTSSVSTIFPKGYPIGTVSNLLKTPDDVFLRASLRPFTEIHNLERVIVLFYKKDFPEDEAISVY